ncbi:hypothetical protein A0H76_673 [Hepatospora eriocheir]|uniref:V-SNARE coiled-coil homology domain-containing protein n=1 Tax=Hepatospora eriocheir TaxID=1081669 RepID=A0A1X0QCL6_9MICR|nr:hypothetical protein HERIO_604 [Hepatospora eriocheir]ORE00474.1 hypothetical protein A0H76_673 [Hepatospora eriocheir]
MNDDLTLQVDAQVNLLQEKLKDRLKQAQDLSDLNNQVFENSLQLEETSSNLKSTSIKTKWVYLLDYLKYISIGIAIIGLLFLLVYKAFSG